PAIEHTPVLTHADSGIEVAPVSSTAQDFMATPHHITPQETVVDFVPGALQAIPTTLPGPPVAALPTAHTPISYATGLRLMLPKYVENHQLMASLSDQVMPRMAEPDTKTLLSRTTDLIKQVAPFNLTYNEVY